LRNGRLSVSLEQSELPGVMAAIAEQSGIEIQVIGLAEPVLLTESFSELPLEVGLRRLLRDLAATFVYSEAVPEPRLKRVLVMPHRAGESQESIPTAELHLAALRESHEGERLSAADEFARTFGGAPAARGATPESAARGATAGSTEANESDDSSPQSALELLFGTSGGSEAPGSAPEQPVPPSAQDGEPPGRDPEAPGAAPQQPVPPALLDSFGLGQRPDGEAPPPDPGF
jgi:hypothetical protein